MNNGLEGVPEHDRLPEIEYDIPSLEGLLDEIGSLALDQQLRVITGRREKPDPETIQSMSSLELEESMEDLSPSIIRDIREFERREGIKEGLQMTADRINEIIRRQQGSG